MSDTPASRAGHRRLRTVDRSRAGRLLPGRADRSPGDHRDLLHAAGPALGDPAQVKSEALLGTYGRFVQSLNGRYYAACDVGTSSEDMDQIARESRFVTARRAARGGAGDSSALTALGVFAGMRAAAEVT